jgi:hypothetical protein
MCRPTCTHLAHARRGHQAQQLHCVRPLWQAFRLREVVVHPSEDAKQLKRGPSKTLVLEARADVVHMLLAAGCRSGQRVPPTLQQRWHPQQLLPHVLPISSKQLGHPLFGS